jgi:hypothetical protein
MKRISVGIGASFVFACALVLMIPSISIAAMTGVTIDNGPACHVSDLSPESMDLITLWWKLNKARDAGTLTPEEAAQGGMISRSGKCGMMIGGTPVKIVLTDGTMYLGEWPDGTLFGFTDGTVLLDEDMGLVDHNHRYGPRHAHASGEGHS